MIANIQEWFKKQLDPENLNSSHSIELATAVLLYEVMRADNKFESLEEDCLRQQLEQHFSLSETELTELCQLSRSQAEDAADYQQFTRVINDVYGLEEKRAVMDSLWSVAYADHQLSPDEDYTIRKIADLLYVPHSEFIQSKLSIKPD